MSSAWGFLTWSYDTQRETTSASKSQLSKSNSSTITKFVQPLYEKETFLKCVLLLHFRTQIYWYDSIWIFDSQNIERSLSLRIIHWYPLDNLYATILPTYSHLRTWKKKGKIEPKVKKTVITVNLSHTVVYEEGNPSSWLYKANSHPK